MKMKQKFRDFFSVTCVSFTIIMLIYTALSDWMNADLTRGSIFSLFAVCAIAGAVIFVTDFIPVGSLLLRLGIDFIDVALTVFIFGGVILKLFSFNSKTILVVTGMLMAAFVGAAALSILRHR